MVVCPGVRWSCLLVVGTQFVGHESPVFTIEYEVAGGTLTFLFSQYDYPSPFWGIRGKPAAHIWQKQRPTGSPSVQGRIHQGTQHQVCYISTLIFCRTSVLFPLCSWCVGTVSSVSRDFTRRILLVQFLHLQHMLQPGTRWLTQQIHLKMCVCVALVVLTSRCGRGGSLVQCNSGFTEKVSLAPVCCGIFHCVFVAFRYKAPS